MPQIALGLLGSLHSTGTGVAVADVALALFGLVAIASGYQNLGRAYAALLAGAIALDSCWLLLYGPELWYSPNASLPVTMPLALSFLNTILGAYCRCSEHASVAVTLGSALAAVSTH